MKLTADLFRLFLGTALLAGGSRLFWFFLGGVGFVFAFDFAERTIHIQSHAATLAIAVSIGLLGAVSAVLLQKYAVLAGGFLAGGYLLIELLKTVGVSAGDYYWLIFIAGGLAGAVLMSVAFGWTLIILSSLMGAILILQAFHLGQQLSGLVFICLVVAGIVIQSGVTRKKSST